MTHMSHLLVLVLENVVYFSLLLLKYYVFCPHALKLPYVLSGGSNFHLILHEDEDNDAND